MEKVLSSKYRLDIDLVFNNLKIKILDMYKSFHDLLSQGPSDKYVIHFTTEKGKGIGYSNKFSETYNKLGFYRDTITLDKTKPQLFQEAIASLVFYLVFIPNAFAVIKSGVARQNPNFAYADAFGLYTHEYVQSSDYKSDNYHGEFLWTATSELYTPEKYKIWMQNFKGIFNPTDIRLFLAFYNKENINTLDYLMKIYNAFLRINSNNPSIDLSEFTNIIDLRI